MRKRMRPWLFLISVMFIGWSGCAPKLTSAPHPVYVGTGLYLERSMFHAERRTEIMDAAQTAGVEWSREEFHWAHIEPERGAFDERVLSEYDRVVVGLLKRGIRILGLLAYRTPWSSGDTAPVTQEERRDYADFAAAMAFRYRGRVDHWEIWNEPNIERFWEPTPDPEAYAALVAMATDAIHAVNPEATVFSASTSGTDVAFIERVVQALGPDRVDGLSFHPYSGDTPWDRSDETWDLQRLLVMMEKYDLNVPLWVTEIGYPTSQVGSGVEESAQAALLVRAYLSLYAAGVENIFSYDFVDDGTDPEDNELHFGVLRHDLSPKPAWHAFRVMSEMVSGSTYTGREDQGSIVMLCFDRSDGARIWAVWDGRMEVKDRRMQPSRGRKAVLPARGAVEAYTLYGEPMSVDLKRDNYSIKAGGELCYLVQRF